MIFQQHEEKKKNLNILRAITATETTSSTLIICLNISVSLPLPPRSPVS